MGNNNLYMYALGFPNGLNVEHLCIAQEQSDINIEPRA